MTDPVYSLRGQYAGFVSRTSAFLIDHGIILGIVAILTAVTGYLLQLVGISVAVCAPVSTVPGLVCVAARTLLLAIAIGFAPIYTILFWTLTGQTPGKYILGLRVYRMDGEPLTLVRSTRRYLGYLLSFLAFGLGFLWITIDDRRQGFHDKVANTCVVYSWDAFQNQRLVNRLSRKLFRSNLFQNPEAFYARGMTPTSPSVTDLEPEVSDTTDASPALEELSDDAEPAD